MVNVQLREGVVFKVTVTFPVEVTGSENTTSISITEPTSYEPDATPELAETIVGAMVSGIAEVVTERGVEAADTIPATSTA